MNNYQKAKEEGISRYIEIEKEWEHHRTRNNCSVCSSPKGHTAVVSFLSSFAEKIKEGVEADMKKKIESGVYGGKAIVELLSSDSQTIYKRKIISGCSDLSQGYCPYPICWYSELNELKVTIDGSATTWCGEVLQAIGLVRLLSSAK